MLNIVMTYTADVQREGFVGGKDWLDVYEVHGLLRFDGICLLCKSTLFLYKFFQIDMLIGVNNS